MNEIVRPNFQLNFWTLVSMSDIWKNKCTFVAGVVETAMREDLRLDVAGVFSSFDSTFLGNLRT